VRSWTLLGGGRHGCSGRPGPGAVAARPRSPSAELRPRGRRRVLRRPGVTSSEQRLGKRPDGPCLTSPRGGPPRHATVFRTAASPAARGLGRVPHRPARRPPAAARASPSTTTRHGRGRAGSRRGVFRFHLGLLGSAVWMRSGSPVQPCAPRTRATSWFKRHGGPPPDPHQGVRPGPSCRYPCSSAPPWAIDVYSSSPLTGSTASPPAVRGRWAGGSLADSVNAAYFRARRGRRSAERHAALLLARNPRDGRPVRTPSCLACRPGRADVHFTTSSGSSPRPPTRNLLPPIPVRRLHHRPGPAFSSSFGHAQGIDMSLRLPPHFAPSALRRPVPDCPVPTGVVSVCFRTLQRRPVAMPAPPEPIEKPGADHGRNWRVRVGRARRRLLRA